MSSLPSDPAALARIAAELTSLRQSVEGMAQQLGQLVATNAALQARLEHSERARADLVAQTEHIVEILADARRELRTLQQKPA